MFTKLLDGDGDDDEDEYGGGSTVFKLSSKFSFDIFSGATFLLLFTFISLNIN
jgi:hypothetical protein